VEIAIIGTGFIGPTFGLASVHRPLLRALDKLGGENMTDPAFADGSPDTLFSGLEEDRITVETIIEGAGLRPIFLDADQVALIDALCRLWIALAMQQEHGRRLAVGLQEC
jgi:hypothetical protein